MLQIKKYHNSYNRTFAETTKLPYNCYRNNETEAFSMKIKSKKKYLTVTKEDVSKFIEYILIARNAYIDDDIPVEDVDKILFRFLKLNKKLRA